MRVSAQRLREMGDRDDGAVVYIVAISLLFLVGMLVLVFDLGRMVATKRDMVNGADAGALAAARECALGHGSDSARAAAVTLLGENATGAALTQFSAPECDVLSSGSPKLVRVGSRVRLDFYFAPIFGFRSGAVAAEAAAQWGPARGVRSPVPIYLNFATLAPCIADPSPDEPVDCTFVFNNEPVSSQFGWLNFPEGWGADRCNAKGGAADIADYIWGSPKPFDAEIPQDPGYVYACGSTGEIASAVVGPFQQRINSSDPYLTFPVTDFDRFPPDRLSGNTYRYPIVGFTRLKVVEAVKGKDVTENAYCAAKIPPGTKVNNSWFCLHLQFVGTQFGGTVPGSGPSYGLQTVRLVD